MTQVEVLSLEGQVTIQTVPGLVEQIAPLLNSGVRCVDFSKVTSVDSAAVALAIEWQRVASERKLSITFLNLPETLRNLANLYGVTEVLASTAA